MILFPYESQKAFVPKNGKTMTELGERLPGKEYSVFNNGVS